MAYLEGISVWADGRPEGRGLTGVCIRENRTNVSQDIFNDPAMIPWKDKAKAFGLRSSVAIPIRAHDQVVGSLNVYAGETDFFLEKEVVLLEEAAAHISFGLDHLKNLEERKKAEEALFEQDELLRQAIQVSQIGIFDHDHRTDTIYWSPQQRLIHGMDPDTPITLQVFIDNIHPDDLEAVSADVRRAHDPAGDGVWNVEHRIRRSDGTVRWLKGAPRPFLKAKAMLGAPCGPSAPRWTSLNKRRRWRSSGNWPQ